MRKKSGRKKNFTWKIYMRPIRIISGTSRAISAWSQRLESAKLGGIMRLVAEKSQARERSIDRQRERDREREREREREKERERDRERHG